MLKLACQGISLHTFPYRAFMPHSCWQGYNWHERARMFRSVTFQVLFLTVFCHGSPVSKRRSFGVQEVIS